MSDLATSLELFKVLADSTRVRLLALLRREELTVAELVRATGLPQPRVSTHLRRLREADLVCDRRMGSSSYYGLPDNGWDSSVEAVWSALGGVEDPLLTSDLSRLEAVIEARSTEAVTWADMVAGRMERHYSPGRTWQSLGRGLAGLCRLGTVVDVASGDGALAELLAPRAQRITCVDLSDAVVQAGRRRLAHLNNVSFIQGDMHALPLESDSADQLLLLAALCYSERPGVALAEAARVLRPGGTLVLVDLCEHPHSEFVADYGHRQIGFSIRQVREWLEQQNFTVELCAPTGRERRPPHFELFTAYATSVG